MTVLTCRKWLSIVSVTCSKGATLKMHASYCWHVQRLWKYYHGGSQELTQTLRNVKD